jgi:hypothetical protein
MTIAAGSGSFVVAGAGRATAAAADFGARINFPPKIPIAINADVNKIAS